MKFTVFKVNTCQFIVTGLYHFLAIRIALKAAKKKLGILISALGKHAAGKGVLAFGADFSIQSFRQNAAHFLILSVGFLHFSAFSKVGNAIYIVLGKVHPACI